MIKYKNQEPYINNNLQMIQNPLGDSLLKNYISPTYPIFIALENFLSVVNSKKMVRDTKQNISTLIQRLGPQGQKYALYQLFECLELPECKQKPNSSFKIQLLAQLLKQYSTTVDFLSYFPQVLVRLNKQHKIGTFFNKLLANLKIPIHTQAILSLSLYLSDRSQFSDVGQDQLIKKLIELKKSNKGSEIPDKIMEELLFQISRNPQLFQNLEEQQVYLLQICENRINQTRIYNYLKADWKFFANEAPIIEKSPTFSVRKSEYLRDLGPSSTHQIDTLKTVLAQVGNLNEEDIFECLMMISEEKGRYQTGTDKFVTDVIYSNKKNYKNDDLKKIFANQISSKKAYSNWNVDNFLTFCIQHVQNLKWQNVIGHFDRTKLEFLSQEHFYNMMKTFEKIKKLGQKWKIPEPLYFKKWVHPSAQAAFLAQVFQCKELQCLQIQQISNKRIQKSVKQQNSLSKQIWGYIDLVQLLFEVSQYQAIEIRQLLQYPMSKYPDLLLQTLSQIRPNKGQALLYEIFCQVLPNFLLNHSANIKLLENLWEANQELVVSCICQTYKAQSKKENSLNLSKVLDITQSIKDSLLSFATWNDLQFAIPLAVLAGKRQFLIFQIWQQDRIQKLGNHFIRAMLTYVDNQLLKPLRKIKVQSQKQSVLEKAQLSVDLLNKIFYTIMNKTSKEQIAPRNQEYQKRLYKQCCGYFPEIADVNIPDEVEKQTEKQINRIYKGEVTVQEAIQIMKGYKNSKKPEDQQMLASHITFLCSELTYHHSYPERELLITAELFGGIINANLIQKKVYQMFLHVLLENMKEDNPKYIFAINVIEKIKAKLVQQSWFCEPLVDYDMIMKKDPQLVEQLIKSIEPPKSLSLQKQKKLKEAIRLKNNPPIETPAIIVLPASKFEIEHSLKQFQMEGLTGKTTLLKKIQINDYDILNTLDKTKVMNFPEKQVKLGKINTICNNLSLNNIEEKAKELENILDTKNAIKLLVHNIMFRRVSISQNNGTQILYRLVERLPKVQKPIISLTYKILQRWFGLMGKSVNDSKINNFKNIGSWLGKLTIGRGYPVPIYKLNLKNILINSFATGNRLNMNVPVVLKILQHINLQPDIFRPTSPWLSRLIGTINEIEDKLKDDQAIKSQIKAFFKQISFKVDSIPMAPTSYLNSNNRIIISQLDKYIKVDGELQKYSKMNINLRMIITRALDDSIQEIVEPVIDRAVKIAKVTTKQIILKDFASEPNPDKFRECSYNVVKNMAGPLAQVTCREPLKASLNRNLKILLSQHITDSNELDSIIQKVIPDNLDFGCTLIKQAVIESAQDSIKKDATINQSIQMRISALKNNKQFKDQFYLKQIPSILPQELRPKVGGLTPEQYFVYTDFKNQERQQMYNKSQEGYNFEKVIEMLLRKQPVKNIKEIMLTDMSFRDQLMQKIYPMMTKQPLEQGQIQYYMEVCQVLADFIDPKDAWKAFKQSTDVKKKQLYPIIKKLIDQKFFPITSLNQVDESNQEQNKAISLFEQWLDTAHQKIEPFLRKLQQIFNKSQNQIKTFFSYSLLYAMNKVEESMLSTNESYDTNYIQNYSKLIIISYKTIASNNCILYLEHTIQAILEVFQKLQEPETTLDHSYQRPFFQLFTNLIGDVTRKQYDIDNDKVLTFYCVLAKQLHKIEPLKYPGFSFAWLELISNKYLIPALLNYHEYWDLYYSLLSGVLKFLRQNVTQQNLYNEEHGQIYQCFYKGVLKLIVVIIHDFPDFLSEFSLQMCLIPGPKFIQLTNMIISAYPKQMKFQFPLKIETKAELIAQAKKGGEPNYYKIQFDQKKYQQFLKSDPRDTNFKQRLEEESDENLQIFVLYAGWPSENGLSIEVSSKKFQDILVNAFETVKQKLIMLMVNLIRYPNSVTLLFINLAEDIIFRANNDTSTRDSLLTNILNRMKAEGPQAWGLDYLVKQLILQKNNLVHLRVPDELLKLL